MLGRADSVVADMDNRFWQRQRGMQDTILVGRKLIAEQSSGKA